MTRFLPRSALAVALCSALAAPVPALAQDPATVVARVGDTEITLGHVVALMARLPQEFRQLPDATLFEGIVEQLVEQTAVAQAVAQPLGARLQADLDNTRREVIVNDVLSRVVEGAVTDEALRALYAEMYLDAEPAREFNAAHILVPSEEEAQELLDALEGGAEFAQLAREHSGDPGSAEAGGSLGWFGAGQMVGPFEEAVMALSPGEVSAPVQTQFGWHIVRLEDTRSAEAPDFDAVRTELATELQRSAVAEHVAAAREGTTIEVTTDGIDPSVIRDQSLLGD